MAMERRIILKQVGALTIDELEDDALLVIKRLQEIVQPNDYLEWEPPTWDGELGDKEGRLLILREVEETNEEYTARKKKEQEALERENLRDQAEYERLRKKLGHA